MREEDARWCIWLCSVRHTESGRDWDTHRMAPYINRPRGCARLPMQPYPLPALPSPPMLLSAH